jgi:SAM-dependent methyltransferase
MAARGYKPARRYRGTRMPVRIDQLARPQGACREYLRAGNKRMRKFLHVGCGNAKKADTTKGFNTGAWHEVRFDIDPACAPDILGTIVDMSAVPDGSVEAIFSSHSIEHVYAHEVPKVLNEFRRVLADDGFVVLTCPDLQSVCQEIARDRLLEPLFTSDSGPIAPLDMLYGHRPSLAGGKQHMAHKCGFTYSVLSSTFFNCGFRKVYGGRRPQAFDLWIIACKQEKTDSELRALAAEHLP